MQIEFATCNRSRALEFLQRAYPGDNIQDVPSQAQPLLDLVEKDVCRIQDPTYHNPPEVVPGTNYNFGDNSKILEACAFLLAL